MDGVGELGLRRHRPPKLSIVCRAFAVLHLRWSTIDVPWSGPDIRAALAAVIEQFADACQSEKIVVVHSARELRLFGIYGLSSLSVTKTYGRLNDLAGNDRAASLLLWFAVSRLQHP